MSNAQPSTSNTESLSFTPQSIWKLITSETSKQTSLLFTAQLLSSAINALSGAILFRSFSPENYGILVFCLTSVIQFLNYFFEFGVFAAGTRLLAIERNPKEVRSLIGSLIFLSVIIGLCFSVLIVSVAEIFGPLLVTLSKYSEYVSNTNLLANPEVRTFLIEVSPLCAILPVQLCLEQICQGLNHIRLLSLLRIMLPTSAFLSILLLSFFNKLTILTALFSSIGAIVFSCVIIAILLKPSFSNLKTNVALVFSETRRFGFDIYFGRITTMISTKLDGILIPLFLGTAQLGFYDLARKFPDNLTNLSRSMAITRFKTFANEPEVRPIIVQSNLLLLISGTLSLIFIGPYLLLLLYTDKSLPAINLLTAFALGAFFGGLFQPYNAFLAAHGQGGELRNISVFIGILNVISLFLVLPRFGLSGAAWMAAIASAINFGLHYYYYKTVCKSKINNKLPHITLIDLSNDTATGIKWVKEKYGEVELDLVNKSEVRSGSQLTRLLEMRSQKRDIFIIFCDRLEWQTRRIPMLIFGLLLGCKESWIVDAHSRYEKNSRLRIIFLKIPHLFVELFGSFLVIISSYLATQLMQILVKLYPLKWKPKTGIPQITFIRTTPTSGAQTGGANSHINGFTKGALENKAKLNFISNDGISGINKEETPITVIEPSSFFNAHRMIFELWNNLTFTFYALGKIKENPPDFIYQRYSRFTFAGVVISWLTKIPLLLEFNGSEVWVGRHWDDASLLWLLEKFELLNLKASQLIFVVSEVEKKNLVKAGVNPSKIVVNFNGVDPEMFRPNQGGEEVRKELGINDKTVVGFVGTFGPWHGVLVLAEAIIKMPKDSNCHFLLIGEGSLKSKVEEIVKTNNSTDRVTFTGRLSHKLVPSYLDACDILVSPHVPMEDGSDFFGSPTKLFEYMAMAKPIVASRLGQIADVIEDKKNGYLLEPSNVNMLVETLTKLSYNPRDCKILGTQAREDVITNYTWKRNAGRVLEAYANHKDD
jgi:glycosyltransferase involved in cell wall biosynthesis/O-antigen/teichoic acid export membrane protein